MRLGFTLGGQLDDRFKDREREELKIVEGNVRGLQINVERIL